MLPEEDVVRLRHILDAACEAVEHATGRTRADLEVDRQLLHSLVDCLLIVGEAATHVSVTCREAHPGVPWAEMTRTRNRLVHVYFDRNRDIVWDTIQDDLPPLIAQMEHILGSRPDG